MKKRALGKTGESLSVIGFGGILLSGTTPAEAARLVASAVDHGVNYFDVAPTYSQAEERLGPALEPYRNQVFLACKTTARLAGPAEAELQQSLKRLRTNRLDLYQFHGVTTESDVDQILSAGGALETFLKARDQGLVRFLGFSAHTQEAAIRLLASFAFDTVLFPINFACWTAGHFGPRVIQKAQERGTGVLALKAMARGPVGKGGPKKWSKCWYEPLDTPAEIKAALAFTLSKPVTAALTPGHAELFQKACDAVEELEADPTAINPDAGFTGAPLFNAPTP
ncbi:MAG: aldo/keto reductase [Kiritimatiellia bacterium]